MKTGSLIVIHAPLPSFSSDPGKIVSIFIVELGDGIHLAPDGKVVSGEQYDSSIERAFSEGRGNFVGDA